MIRFPMMTWLPTTMRIARIAQAILILSMIQKVFPGMFRPFRS